MSKRNTIIIAVLINASLLVVLFISAVKTKEDVINESKIAVNELVESTAIDANSLFSTETKTAEVENNNDKEFVALSSEIKPLENKSEPAFKEEEKIVHVLPKTVSEDKEVKEEKIVVTKNQELLEHVVKKGDNLDKIAKANNVNISEIIKLNHLPNTFLKINQKLKIPKKNQIVAKQTEVQNIKDEFYIVKTGDNPYTIAMKHNIRLSDLLKINNLDDKKAKRLKPGDKLKIR